MKNRNNIYTTILVALAFALAPGAEASPKPDGGPTYLNPTSTARSNANSDGENEGENLPVVTIHATDNVIRGKTGSFVLTMKPVLMLGGTYVNFKVSGTAVAGVDYELLVSPARIAWPIAMISTGIGQTGYGVIQVQTLPDPRGSSFRQAYSVVITLESGAGYTVGASRSATMWIKP